MARFLSVPRPIHCWLLSATLVIGTGSVASAQMSSGLISQRQAASVGLKRAWFARAQINPARSALTDWILSGDQLLILTNSGVLQAIDANTGKTNWVTPFGNPDYPSLGPDANDQYVAVINGSTLYVLDVASGHVQGQRIIGGSPGAGPAVGKDYVFVPTINGLIEGYPLDLTAPGYKKWFYQSFGHILAPPLVTSESVAWTTDRGNLYVSGAAKPGVRFRLETFGKFDARPAYRAPLIYAAALSGELFAVDEVEAKLVWRYTTGYPTKRAPAAVGERLFVTSEEPMLHCVDASTGLPHWQTPGITQFAAVTKAHVYGVDRYGTVHVLNIADGAPVGTIPTGGELTALVNDQTDRLFLISTSGLVECLYEIGADKPTYYAAPPAVKEAPVKPEAEPVYHGDGQPAAKPPLEPAAKQSAPPASKPATPPAAAPQNGSPFEEPAAAPESGNAKPAATPAPGTEFGSGDENPFN